MPFLDTRTLSDVRKKELLNNVRFIMTDLFPTGKADSPIKGKESLAMEIINRIEQITNKTNEFKFLVDVVLELIVKGGTEVQVFYKGRLLTREVLSRDFGVFLAPKKPN